MASGGAIRAGRAFIEIFTEDSAVGRGLRAASAKMAAWGASVNTLGASIGAAVGTTFGAMAKGAKIAGFAIAGIGAGLIGAAKLFADADRSTMTGEQAAAADRMRDSFASLKDTALGLNAAFSTALQPTIGAMIDFVRLGMNAFRSWIDSHRELLDGVNRFVSGVRDALSAGDIGLAAEIAWAQMKTAWAAGVAWVMQATLDWKTSLQQTMSEAFLGLQDIGARAWGAIADAAGAAADYVAKKWERAVGFIARGVASAGEFTGMLPKGTGETLAEDQSRAFKKTDEEMDRRSQDRAKNRAKEEERRAQELGESVLAANKAIADSNRASLDEAKANLESKQNELQSLLNKAKEVAKPIETGIKEGVGEKGSVAGAFGGGRMLGQLAGDVSGKSIADNTRETAKQTKRTADAVATMAAREPGLAVM